MFSSLGGVNCIQIKLDIFTEKKVYVMYIFNGRVLHGNIDQTLVNYLHDLMNCEIGGLDSHIITAEHLFHFHWTHTHVTPIFILLCICPCNLFYSFRSIFIYNNLNRGQTSTQKLRAMLTYPSFRILFCLPEYLLCLGQGQTIQGLLVDLQYLIPTSNLTWKEIHKKKNNKRKNELNDIIFCQGQGASCCSSVSDTTSNLTCPTERLLSTTEHHS